jgi:hypothetical protein
MVPSASKYIRSKASYAGFSADGRESAGRRDHRKRERQRRHDEAGARALAEADGASTVHAGPRPVGTPPERERPDPSSGPSVPNRSTP